MGKGSRVLVGLSVGLLVFAFLSLPLYGGRWLHEVTNTPLGKRPEFFYTWTLIATAQIASWIVSIIILRKDLATAAFKSRPAYFWLGLLLNAVTIGGGTVVAMLWADRLPFFSPWRLNFYGDFGATTTHTLVAFVVVASLSGGAMVGVAASQFGELLKPDLKFKDLVAILGRIKRSFLSLTIMLTLAVFSTARLHAAILLVHKYEFSSELVLAYGLLMSLIIVIFYLPVLLRYQQVAEQVLLRCQQAAEQALAEKDSPDAEEVLEQEDAPEKEWDFKTQEERDLMRSALGLTTLSGVESLVGALGPALGALWTLSKGK